MLINVLIKGATHVVHEGETFKVVEGIADVSEAASKHLLNFKTDYTAVTEEVDKKILAKLQAKADKDQK